MAYAVARALVTSGDRRRYRDRRETAGMIFFVHLPFSVSPTRGKLMWGRSRYASISIGVTRNEDRETQPFGDGWSDTLPSNAVTTLAPDAVRDALLTETDLLAELYRTADTDTPIPTCPDWTLADLVAHVGGGHHWAATMITEHATERIDYASVPDARRPHDRQTAAHWLRDSARQVLSAVDATGAEVPVWTPFGSPRSAGWWIRRRLHESSAHRADALLALDRDVVIAPEVAADGVSELLDLIAMGSARFRTPLDDGDTLCLIATDLDAAWSIVRTGDVIAWSGRPRTATVTVRGSAVELFLLVLRRVPAAALGSGIIGDRAVLDAWLERVAF